MASRQKTRTTTVRLPRSVYEQAKLLVEKEKAGSGAVLSLNDFIVSAVKTYLKMYERKKIDAAFARMAEDADYQKEATLLAEEFAYSDWEALQIEERDLIGAPTDADSSSR